MVGFNTKQFKQKKKRPMDPNAPPRPNLLSHDKKIREARAEMDHLVATVAKQERQIADMNDRIMGLQISIQQLTSYLRSR